MFSKKVIVKFKDGKILKGWTENILKATCFCDIKQRYGVLRPDPCKGNTEEENNENTKKNSHNNDITSNNSRYNQHFN